MPAPIPTPVVHVGFHGTATAWFRRDVYPHVLNRRHVPREAVRAALLEPGAFRFDAATARGALPPGPGLVLCEEDLSGHVHNGGLHGFLPHGVAERIRATLPDARIVMLVRSQPAIVAASYARYLRDGGTHGPPRYLFPRDHLFAAAAEPWRAPRFSFDHFDYHPLAERYAELFGRDRVHVYPYEALAADRAGFLRRFAADLELEFDWDRIGYRDRDASYDRAAAWTARLLNRFTARSVMDKRTWAHLPGFYSATRPLLERMARLSGERPTPADVLGRRTVAWIEGRYWQSNGRLAEAFGLDLAAHAYPLAPPDRPAERPRAAGWRRAPAR